MPFPPNKGDKIRSFHILKYLSQNHQVSLACPVDSNDDLKYIKDLKPFCYTIDWVKINPEIRKILSIKALLKNEPLSVDCFYSKQLQIKIDHRLAQEKFDAIYIFSSQMAVYVESHNQIKRIMDFVDIDSLKWSQYANFIKNPVTRWIYKRESKKLAAYEKAIAEKFDVSIFVSDDEAEKFRMKIYNGKNILAVHNGVDYNYFSPNGNVKTDPSPIILFTGAMDYYPNIDAVTWFAEEIFPLIKSKINNAKFYIVGNRPTEQIRRLHDNVNIIVTGFVEDIRTYYQLADVFVAPFRIACGVQNKILEALSMNVQVVASPLGAEGIKKGNPIVVEAEKSKFANIIKDLLTCKKKEKNQIKNWIIQNYNWENNLKGIYDACAKFHTNY